MSGLMFSLVQNEIMKMLYKKKWILILILLILFVGLFSYGERFVYEKTVTRFEMLSEDSSYDWVNLANQQIEQLKGRLDSPYIPENAVKSCHKFL